MHDHSLMSVYGFQMSVPFWSIHIIPSFPTEYKRLPQKLLQAAFLNIEAEKGTRTLDPRITNALLYQLSYFGIYKLLPYAIG
jgi:hypothetical protein